MKKYVIFWSLLTLSGVAAATETITINPTSGTQILNNAIAIYDDLTSQSITLSIANGEPVQTVNISPTNGSGIAVSPSQCIITSSQACTVTIYKGNGDAGIGQLQFTNTTTVAPVLPIESNLTVLWGQNTNSNSDVQYEAAFNVNVNVTNGQQWDFETASDNSSGASVHGLPAEGRQPYAEQGGAWMAFAGLPSEFSTSDYMKPKLYLTPPSGKGFGNIYPDKSCSNYNFVIDDSGKNTLQAYFNTTLVGLKQSDFGYFTADILFQMNSTSTYDIYINNCQFAVFS